MKTQIKTTVLAILFSTHAFAFDLQIDVKNEKASPKDVKSAENLIRSINDYFPDLIEKMKLNVCGSGGPACDQENSYQFDTNEINLELTSYDESGEIKYKIGALQVLSHEFGHAVFIKRATDRHRNYARLFAAAKYEIEQGKKLLVAKGNGETKQVQEIEAELEAEKETLATVRNYFYASSFYQEVYSDLLMAAHFNNPDIVCLALDGTTRCTSPLSAARRFSVSTSTEASKKMTVGNSQGQHSALAATRKPLWEKYKALLKTGNSKSMALNFLLDLMVDESYKTIFGEKSYGLDEMNASLLESLQTYGK